ncbi:MAG: fumarylacetoacetate hydrolase family protein, partial [Candidatus Korarchaeum sp.]|nr:fumarylacetoacetate hydrolase family protein [Candidatus Korarchaeum sp.]MDW8036215.1 fumarylacetoacetate hydrolase family protein [Candidatus Korarchaeum sp.]
MRLLSFRYKGVRDYGLSVGDEVVPSAELSKSLGKGLPPTLDELIKTPLIDDVIKLGEKTLERTIKLEEVDIVRPISDPPKIICLGRNYVEHATEIGSEPPKEPVIFMKPRTSLNDPFSDVLIPDDYTLEVDYEGEIAFVVRRGGRKLSEDEAKSSILGYLAFNDVTARDLQRRDKQWVRGKSLDGFAPIGPWIEVSVGFEELGVSTWVNGELRQKASSREMIFKPWEILAILSRGMTMEAGDLIATGTPAGV